MRSSTEFVTPSMSLVFSIHVHVIQKHCLNGILTVKED